MLPLMNAKGSLAPLAGTVLNFAAKVMFHPQPRR
jgi:hypothetical protein